MSHFAQIDANNIVKKLKCDILYLDPPYNQRQYASNYHVLETIAKYDNPELRGKTGLRNYSAQKSLYSSRSKVKEAFKELINNADAKYIFLSYNDEGLMTLEDIRKIMSAKGQYGVFKKRYSRYKSDKDINRKYKKSNTNSA